METWNQVHCWQTCKAWIGWMTSRILQKDLHKHRHWFPLTHYCSGPSNLHSWILKFSSHLCCLSLVIAVGCQKDPEFHERPNSVAVSNQNKSLLYQSPHMTANFGMGYEMNNLLNKTMKVTFESYYHQHSLLSHGWLMEKNFYSKQNLTHEQKDHQKLEGTTAMYLLKLYDILLVVHPFL